MKKITPEILDKYYNNICSPDEKLLISEWLDTQKPQSLNEEKLLTESWEKIAAKTIDKKNKSSNFTKSLYYKYGSIAAALAILLFSSIYIFNTFFTTIINGVEYVNVDFNMLSTDKGQRKIFQLSDGSSVTLNSNSQIQVPTEFTKDNRIVHLKGHAHFDVKRDENRPFIIYTAHSKTQVLGTSFDIIANSKSKNTEVVVTSGKVAFSELENQKNTVYLTVDKQGILYNDKPIQVNEVVSNYNTAWKDNILIFENRSLNDIVKVLEKWYAINITVKNQKLLNRKFTFTYDNPSLEETLEAMGFVVDFKYTIKNNNIVIY